MKCNSAWFWTTLVCCGVLNAQEGSPHQKDSLTILELEEVVVSDSRFELNRANSGKTVIKIDQVEISKNQGRTLAELINTKSGIEINGSRSYAGQNLSSYVRGGNNRQILVVIDGIQVFDASSTSSEYDLRLLNLSQIEHVEILKGAASTLYGNSAATAVINIKTKEASKDGLSMNVLSGFGTNQSQKAQQYSISDFSNTVNIAGKTKNLSIWASGGHQYTDGLSAAIGVEPDALSRIDGSLKITYGPIQRLEITVATYYNKLNSDYDNGFPIEDADYSFSSEQFRYGLSSIYKYENGTLNINTAVNTINRQFMSDFPAAYDSKTFVLDVFNKYTFMDKLYTIVGINQITNKTQFISSENTRSWDPYINAVYVSGSGFNLNTGARLNNHSDYGHHFIYNLNPSYRINISEGYINFLTSYATSFIAPNLSQLYGPFGPNPNLRPESNTTFEAGFVYTPSANFSMNALYYNRKEEDRIDYVTIDPTTFESQYMNATSDANFEGVEIGINAMIFNPLNYTANYTFTSSKEKLALRIPKHKINASLAYNINEETTFSLSYQYVSKRQDIDFNTFSEVNLDSFSLFDVQFNKSISPRLSYFVSISNLLNQDYFELVNYTTKGRNAKIGFRLSL